jgi:hypothetical protein
MPAEPTIRMRAFIERRIRLGPGPSVALADVAWVTNRDRQEATRDCVIGEVAAR